MNTLPNQNEISRRKLTRAVLAVLDSRGCNETIEKKLREREVDSIILRALERACAWSEIPLARLHARYCELRESAIQGLQDSGGYNHD